MNAVQFVATVKRFAPLLISVGIAVVFALVHITIESEAIQSGPLSDRGYLRLLDKKMLDLKFVGREMEDLPEPKVIVAAIDEKGLKKYGLWPWSRTVVADFIRKTTEGGARVIAFDAIFADEDKNSSYQNIKRFVDAYERAGLRPEAARMVEVKRQLEQAFEAQAQSQKALKAAEARVRREKGPRKAQLTQSLLPAVKATQRTGRAVDEARADLGRLREASRVFFQSMRSEVASASPDEALAHAVGESPQTILGFITYLKEEEFEGISPEQMKLNLELLEPSAIHKIYEMESYDYGDVVRPVEDIDISEMWVHPIKGALAPLPMLAKRATSFGFFNASPDADGQMRSIRLLHRYESTLYPSLTLATVAKYFNANIEPLNSQIFPGERLGGVSAGNGAIPTNMRGHFFLNYYMDPREYFETYSVADFIDGTVPPEKYKDKIVLFGMTAHGLKQDLRATPYSPATPGVYVHATAIQNILDKRYLERIFGIALIEVLVYILLGVALGLGLPRIPAWAGVLATVGFAVGLYMFDVLWMFPRGTWIMTVLPTLQAVATLVGVVVHGYFTEGREKAKIRKAFQFYLTKSVVDEMLKDTTKLQLGGERRTCTVLFSDIRGFTTISERLSPEELVSLLNSYLTPMTNLVFKYDGTLDKYMGDAIMAIFGAPVPYSDHATRACYSSLEMMEELLKLQAGWRKEGLPEIDIGIGLNTGPMSVGNMGSEIRFDYTVMGDNVNLGSRLEGINKQYGTNIIISEFTNEAAQEDIHTREMDSVRVKGKREPVRIYELLGKGKPNREKKALIETFEGGIAAYKARRWDEAIAVFEQVRAELKPNDYASAMYIERCEQYRARPPSEDWDGVYVMTTK